MSLNLHIENNSLVLVKGWTETLSIARTKLRLVSSLAEFGQNTPSFENMGRGRM